MITPPPELARTDLLQFCRYLDPAYEITPHLVYLAEKLKECEHYVITGGREGIGRLIVNMPPRHGKSLTISKRWPSFLLAQHNTWRIGLLAYNDEISHDFSRANRALFEESEEFRRLFPDLDLNPDTTAVHRWSLANRSADDNSVIAAGIHGTVVGRGFQIILIDDPIKEREEAESPAYRRQLQDVYKGSIRTRLEPGGVIILIHCLAAGSRILVKGGWQAIETLKPGDEVWSYPVGGKKLERRLVKVIIPQPTSQTLTIKTVRHSLRVTGEHPLLVARGGARFERELNGKFPVQVDGDRRTWFWEWVLAKDLRVKDYVATVKNVDWGHRKRWPITQRLLDNEDMWLLGYLWGDGWVTKRTRAYGSFSYAVCVALGVYEDRNTRAEQALIRAFGRKPTITTGRYFRLDHNEAGRQLETLGLTPGVRAPLKKLPDWIFRCRPSDKCAFLRGLIDADGHKPKDSGSDNYRLASSSLKLLEGVQLLALTCGVRSTAIYQHDLKSVQPPGSPLPFDTVGYSVGLTFENGKAEKKSVFSYQPAFKHIRLDKITSIETNQNPEQVFDLALEGPDENFIAEGFVVHNTRWHEEDLAGWLMAQEKIGEGEHWERVNLPAIAEADDPLGRAPGEALWSTRFNVADLALVRKAVGIYEWASQWSGHPSPPTGGRIKREWFNGKVLDQLPERFRSGPGGSPPKEKLRYYRYWDLALTTKKKSNKTASCRVAFDDEQNLYVADMISVKMEWPDAYELIVTTMLAEQTMNVTHGIEEAMQGIAAVQEFSRDKRLKRIAFTGVKVDKDKLARANPWIRRADNGKVFLIAGPWVADFLNKCVNFTGKEGDEDDEIDSVSGGVQMAGETGTAQSLLDYYRRKAEEMKKTQEKEKEEK